ncbi:uncharacterized protein ISCGN_028944 [Ixodes scapularis]
MYTAKMAVRTWYGTVTVIFLCTFSAQWGACDVQTCGSALLTSCFPADGARSPKVKFQISGVTVESLKEDCTNADAISTCVNDLKMDGCQDEERRQLQLLKDGLRTTRNSLCHEDLYQSMVDWNRCLNQTSFHMCMGEYNDERTTLEGDGRLTRDERECRYGEYACFLKSAEGCPSTSLAREAVNDLYNTNLDLNNCTRFDGSLGKQRCDAERYWECFKRAEDRTEFPKAREEKLLAEDCKLWYGTVTVIFLCTFSAQWGACDVQTCGSALLTSCFPADGARSPKVKFQISGVTVESLKEDCTNADAISTCVNGLKMDGCQDEERRQLQLLKDGLRTTRNSLCHEDLYQSMVDWNRCLNQTSFHMCMGEYNDERTTLEGDGRLTRDERECRYGEYACFLKSTEGCPSTSLAREAVNDLHNTNLDLNNCTRFDGSLGKQRVLESVDSCTKYMENGGCSDELKQKLQYLKSDFASLRSLLCDPNLHTSVLEWNQCLNESAFQSCLDLLPQETCSTGNYNCFLNATTRCTRDSPAMKAVHHAINIHLDLKNCSRIDGNDVNINTPLHLKNCSSIDCNDGNGGIITSPKILLTLAALCISLFPLRK